MIDEMCCTSIVYKHVESAKMGDGLCEHGLNCGFVGHIRSDHKCFHTLGTNLDGSLFSIVARLGIIDNDVVATVCQLNRCRATNACCRAGYQSNFSGGLHHETSSFWNLMRSST